MRSLPRVAAAIVLVLGGACRHPMDVVTPHVEVADMIVRDSTMVEIARTVENRRWTTDSLLLGDARQRLSVELMDFQGKPISLTDRRDLEIRVEAEDESFLQWEPQVGFGWLLPFKQGVTRIRFVVWHVSHADFVSPWIRLRVNEQEIHR